MSDDERHHILENVQEHTDVEKDDDRCCGVDHHPYPHELYERAIAARRKVS